MRGRQSGCGRKGDEAGVTLDMVKKGQDLVIVQLPKSDVRAQAMRLGIYEGAQLSCVESIHNGPVVLRSAFQEIAIGQHIAREIQVTVQEENKPARRIVDHQTD